MNYAAYIWKRRVEDVMMLPLIWLGRILASIRPLGKTYKVFYFFSFYHTGGAEKVHAQIAQAIGGKDCIIWFTRRSVNESLKKAFQDSGCHIRDISRFTDNKWLYPVNIIFRGLIAGYINRQQSLPLIFNGQCNFAYKISPWIKGGISQVELIHSFNTFSWIRIPFLPFITRTIMISRERIADHLAQYRRIGIPAAFDSRISYIGNAIELPAHAVVKKHDPFIVLYAGRGGTEKRLHLITAIASTVHAANPAIRFEIMGDVSAIVPEAEYPFIHFYGNVNDPARIAGIYERASVLLLTSDTEGFPMVIIEAMAYGNAILSTPVGDIPRHITSGKNGFLFSNTADESRIVQEGIIWINQLYADHVLLTTIAGNNTRYAHEHFSIAAFRQSYQGIFNQLTGQL